MKIEARFRRRASLEEGIDDLNAGILSRLSKIDGFWISGHPIADAKLDSGTGESAGINISMCLQFGMKAAISYASRQLKSISDKAIYDDTLLVQIDTDTIGYKSFCRNIFPEIVKSLGAYRANIVTDLEQDFDDFEDIILEAQRTGKDVDGRDTVFRFYPANYFDDLLCDRAFGLSANEVVMRLVGSVALAENLQSGALIILIEEPVLASSQIALETKIRRLLEL